MKQLNSNQVDRKVSILFQLLSLAMLLGLPSNILILVVSYMTLHKNPSSSCLLVNMAIAGIFISINISIKLKNEVYENTNWE